MAEETSIAWCDSTFNPWIGCTKVSPGCDRCYAEALDKRHRWSGATHWGVGVPRMRTGKSNWHQPVKWNAAAVASGDRHLVFCASLADVFDNDVPEGWRFDLMELVRCTPALTWLILTKRIVNVPKMLPHWWHDPAAWKDGGGPATPFHNVWLGASVVNQEEADRDIPKLLATPATKHFVSYEPALGPIDFEEWLDDSRPGSPALDAPRRGLDWIIVGGESRQGKELARHFDINWALSTMRQCREAGVAFFMKQTGSDYTALYERTQKHRSGADPSEWPEALRVQDFPT